MTRLQPASALLAAALLVAGCAATGFVPVDGRSAECAGHAEPQMCQQALEAVVAEVGDRTEGGQIRIDPVQCAHGRCWTWAYVTPPDGGGDQQLSIDWLPNGEISVGYVVQD